MKKNVRDGANGRYIAVAIAVCTCSVLIAQSAWAVIDYDRNLAADFTATYPGGNPTAGVPVGNPFGNWTLRGENGLAADLQTSGGLPASGQAGWCQQHAGVCDTGGPWTYFANPWQPGVTINPTVNGHGPQDVLWTAPANIDEGGIVISGSLEQVFEPTREMRLSIFKNNSATPFFTKDALPPTVNGVLLNRVNFSGAGIAISPGDTLRFQLAGSGSPPPANAGVSTFLAWNVRLQETRGVVPEPASASLLLVCAAMLWGARRGTR
jgi:hypothetical protein